MVEQAAAGEAPSSPQPPEPGARRARLYGVLSATENRNRETISPSRCGAAMRMWRLDRISADFEHMADLEFPEAEGMGYAIRLPANNILQ